MGCLVCVVIAGYLLYGAAGRSAYSDGAAAQARGDCATAVARYDTVTGLFELTLRRYVPAAAVNRAQCVAFAAASQA